MRLWVVKWVLSSLLESWIRCKMSGLVVGDDNV